MKKLFVLLLIIFTTVCYSQTNYVRGFNNGYKEGYCHDKGIGCIEPIPPTAPIPKIGESSGSYKDGYNRGFEMGLQANNNSSQTQQSSGIIHDYGEPQSMFDTDLAIMALAAKQRQYDRLSPQQKAQLAWAREYKRQKEFVYFKSYKPLKKAIKYFDKTKKKNKRVTKRNRRKVKGEKHYSASSLDDGWYKAYIDSYNFLFERVVHIKSGKIDKYLNGQNLLADIINIKEEYNNTYKLKASVYGEEFESNLFIIDDKKQREPEYNLPSKLMFYTKSENVTGKIDIILKTNNGYIGIKPIKYYISDTPSCRQKEGVAYHILPPGKYTYYAFSETSFWTDKIEISPNKCKKINLVNN